MSISYRSYQFHRFLDYFFLNIIIIYLLFFYRPKGVQRFRKRGQCHRQYAVRWMRNKIIIISIVQPSEVTKNIQYNQ